MTGPRADDFSVELSGRRLSVVAPRSRFFDTRQDSHVVRVIVPSGSDLVTRTGSADTGATGTLGTVRLKTGSGDVRCQEASADVRIKSGSGDVDLGEVGGSAGISTGSGDVVIGVVHDKTVIKTGSGDLELTRAESDVSLSTASGDLTVGRAPRGRVTAKNVSGDVRVGIPSGTPVWTDVTTMTGSVASDLTSRGEPAQGQDHVEVRATTVSGDVYLRQV